MIAPGALVIGSPLIAGFVFGPAATAGVLAGTIVSGVQVAISASNTGGAWDNAKKEVEKNRREFQARAEFRDYNDKECIQLYHEINADPTKYKEVLGTKSEDEQKKAEFGRELVFFKEKHVAAVIGDTVGDPLKDTSGPAINILVKLSAITSLVFGSYIKNYHYFNKTPSQ